MIVLAVLAVYLPTLFLPYYFVDDLWLYRRPESGFPDVIEVVMFRQGRPIFGALALAMQEFRTRLGIEVMVLARSVAVISLAGFAYSLHRFLELWQTPLSALCLSILLITLPSFQMYVTAAPLFAPSLAYCGLVLLLFGRMIVREQSTRRESAFLFIAVLGLVFVWATYQALPLVVVGLLPPLLLSDRWWSNPRWKTLAAFVAMVGVSLGVYFSFWLIANIGIPSDLRYSPKAVGFHIFENVQKYRTMRSAEIFGFWNTRAHGHSYVYECLALLAIAFAIDLAHTKRNRLGRALVWSLAAIAPLTVDIPLFFAPPSNTFSYMTSAPSAAAMFVLVATAAQLTVRKLATSAPVVGRIAVIGSTILCGTAIALGARNVLMNQVVPNWLEYALVRAELRRQLTGESKISWVTLYARGSLLAEGRNEFSWTNFGAPFWAHWAVRDILDELGAESRIHIDVVDSEGAVKVLPQSWQSHPIVPPNSGRHVTIDLRALDLSAPSAETLHQPPSLPGYENFWTRKLAWRHAAELMRRVPDDVRVLPVARIFSTLTYVGLGAVGEQAAIDGNLTTAAADPGGFHQGTSITLALRSVAEVKGIRILSAPNFGIEIPGTLRVTCDQDNSVREMGTIVLQPGTEVVTEAFWDAPCRTGAVHLDATGLAVNTNFWIAEIQVFGITVG